jgi:hypothetical protein
MGLQDQTMVGQQQKVLRPILLFAHRYLFTVTAAPQQRVARSLAAPSTTQQVFSSHPTLLASTSLQISAAVGYGCLIPPPEQQQALRTALINQLI